MKKIYALAVALVLLSLTAFTAIGVTVNHQSDKVTLTESILYGDKAAAEGLTVVNKSYYDYRLFWDTTYKIGKENTADTAFEFSAVQKTFEYDRRNYGIELYDGIEYGFDENLPASEQTGIARAYKEIFDATAEGETSKKTVYLADYYDYYPIKVNVDLPNVKWLYDTAEHNELVKDFNEFFKIPVHESEFTEIEVSKNEKGQHYGSGSTTSHTYNLYSLSTCTDTQCFFAINNRIYTEFSGYSYADTSQIKDGYGIYAFNYGKSSSLAVIDTESLKTVYPLDESISVQHLAVSPDQTKLLLFTVEGDASYFTVLDIATMTELQRFIIDNGIFSSAYEYDDFIVAQSDKGIAVISFDGSTYKLEFSVPSAGFVDERFQYDWNADHMDFDGEKLAVVGSLIDYEYGYENCGFFLSVYDASGLLCYAEYKNSLSIDEYKNQYHYNCHPHDYQANTVEWS